MSLFSKKEELKLWPTNVGIYEFSDVTDLNAQLYFDCTQQINALKNQIGDQPHYVFSLDTPAAHQIAERLLEAFRDHLKMYDSDIGCRPGELPRAFDNAPEMKMKDIIDIWYFCIPAGVLHHERKLHNHSGSDFTSVYWVNVEDGADLEIFDPRWPDHNLRYTSYIQHTIQAKPGKMVIAPGYTWHQVAPQVNKSTRISMVTTIKLPSAHFPHHLKHSDEKHYMQEFPNWRR
ncbi:MAG: putative 2OG-Fe(II) oxygenase [Oligoflexia bacterium]|nr:putative 2OG-Fe(II) oxygenase [Oligoflexia bacterium]